MTNKFHNAWRGFLNEQEDEPSDGSSSDELTKEELAMWQQALKDVKGSFSLKESFLLEFLNEHDNKILLEVEEEGEPENPEEPEYDPVRDHPETVTGDEALEKMRTTQAQQKAAGEEEYEKLRTSTPPGLEPTGQASFDFPKPGDEFIIPISSKYSSESDFCQVFPEINRWTQENADNFGEAILFVYATMQTSWPRVATFFRFLVDFVKENADSPEAFENFVYRPKRDEQQTDYNEYKFYLGRKRYASLARRLREAKKLKVDPARKRQIRKKIKELASLQGRGGQKRIETNKRIRARYERLVSLLEDSKNIKKIEREIKQEVDENKQKIEDANGVSYEEARDNYIQALGGHNSYRLSVLKALFKSVKGLQEKGLSKEQEEYIGRARGIIAYMAATPGAKFYVPTWNRRTSYFSSVSAPLKEYNKSKDPSNLLDLLVEVVRIPGIGVVKGGFLVQLLTGQLGCIDNVWQKILVAQDQIIADRVKKIVRTSKNREKDLREYASRYISLLDTLEKAYSIDSKNIFEVWLQVTKFASTRDGDKKGYKLDIVTLPQGADLAQSDSFLRAKGVKISAETDQSTLDYYRQGGGPAKPMEIKKPSEEDKNTEFGAPSAQVPGPIAQQHRFGQLGYPVEEGRVERTFKKWKKMEWL